MRVRILLALFAAATLALVSGSASYGQIPGGGQPKRQLDPNRLFSMFAKGQPSIFLADLPDQRSVKTFLIQYAQQNGITDGKITQEQFAAFSASELGVAFYASIQGKRGNGPGMGAPTGPPGAPGAAQGNPIEAMLLMADTEFKQRDANGDGKLNPDEMPRGLRQSVAAWDKNGDGLIDATEYRAYFISRLQNPNGGRFPGSAQLAPAAPVEDDLDKRPVVFRAGKLPDKGLPSWFKKLDTDGDAQVALYEWRAAGKDMAEFKQWDRDDDGFITPDEALYVQAALIRANPKAAIGGSGRQRKGG